MTRMSCSDKNHMHFLPRPSIFNIYRDGCTRSRIRGVYRTPKSTVVVLSCVTTWINIFPRAFQSIVKKECIEMTPTSSKSELAIRRSEKSRKLLFATTCNDVFE